MYCRWEFFLLFLISSSSGEKSSQTTVKLAGEFKAKVSYDLLNDRGFFASL